MANKVISLKDADGNNIELEPKKWQSANSWSAFVGLATDAIAALNGIDESLSSKAEGIYTGVMTNTGGSHYGYIVFCYRNNYYSGILLGHFGLSMQFRRTVDTYNIRQLG